MSRIEESLYQKYGLNESKQKLNEDSDDIAYQQMYDVIYSYVYYHIYYFIRDNITPDIIADEIHGYDTSWAKYGYDVALMDILGRKNLGPIVQSIVKELLVNY